MIWSLNWILLLFYGVMVRLNSVVIYGYQLCIETPLISIYFCRSEYIDHFLTDFADNILDAV